MTQDELFKVLVAHCKEYGFIFPSSEIYDGLAAVYDYGQMGSELKQNIKQYWWNAMTRLNENIVGIDYAFTDLGDLSIAQYSHVISIKVALDHLKKNNKIKEQ